MLTNHITNILSPLYKDNGKAPSMLFELSTVQHKRMKKNTIHVCGRTWTNVTNKGPEQTLYSNVIYGSNITDSISNKKVNIVEHKWYKYINFSKRSKRYCIIRGDKDEILRLLPNTHIFGCSVTDKRGANRSRNDLLSGIFILMTSTLHSSNTNTPTELVWDDYMYDKVKSCKPNVMKSYNHHGSSGNCFSFGTKPLYGMVGGKAVVVYSTKRVIVRKGKKILIYKQRRLRNYAWP